MLPGPAKVRITEVSSPLKRRCRGKMRASFATKFPTFARVAGRSAGLLPQTKRSLFRFAATGTTIPKLQSLAERKTGEDAFFVTANAIGVADGVGGWASEGIDPSRMSRKVDGDCHDLSRAV